MENILEANKTLEVVKKVINNAPSDWIDLTTHRLDIYEEKLAKTQFLAQFEELYHKNDINTSSLSNLPTAYDYIRLGHPLSSILEWSIAQLNNIHADQVIAFSSKTVPLLAVLRTNALLGEQTLIAYTGKTNPLQKEEILKEVYNYTFQTIEVDSANDIPSFDGHVIFIANENYPKIEQHSSTVNTYVTQLGNLGSVLIINEDNKSFISEIQHVRRRETIAMTPANSLTALQMLVDSTVTPNLDPNFETNKNAVLSSIKEVTQTNVKALLGSSGLSIQYAIMMGLIHHAKENHSGKPIKIIVPTNCYGGTNDQARRVAALTKNVEVVDLLVDRENNMVDSLETVLSNIASQDGVPLIIAEIPTNPRVEVPNLVELRDVLTKDRQTSDQQKAIEPVFILDQTFCPNVHFLGDNEILASVKTIAYVSGSKFPSGGKCTAGYCTANQKAKNLMNKIEQHLKLCDNEATEHQIAILAKQMPSMNQRIAEAYKNTRAFVNYIHEVLPTAKINFVSEELAEQGFTPSVFSLDLPTKGNNHEEREEYKRALNLRLINLMITELPNASKYCVSYGQLKGSYWTIPATSTQGTTKESDKDYIARVAFSPDLDLDTHKRVFKEFVEGI